MRQQLGAQCPVQVFTSLPPGIQAPVTAHLTMSITLFRVIPRRNSSAATQGRRGAVATPSHPPDTLSVRVRWWGEPSGGECAVFNPRLAHKVGHKQHTCTRARYKITVPLERFNAYLKDMRALYLDILENSSHRAIGRARIDRIDRLTLNHPIDTVLTVINDVGEKIGDLTVFMSIEPVTCQTGVRPLDEAAMSHAEDPLTEKEMSGQELAVHGRLLNGSPDDHQWMRKSHESSVNFAPFVENGLSDQHVLDGDVPDRGDSVLSAREIAILSKPPVPHHHVSARTHPLSRSEDLESNLWRSHNSFESIHGDEKMVTCAQLHPHSLTRSENSLERPLSEENFAEPFQSPMLLRKSPPADSKYGPRQENDVAFSKTNPIIEQSDHLQSSKFNPLHLLDEPHQLDPEERRVNQLLYESTGGGRLQMEEAGLTQQQSQRSDRDSPLHHLVRDEQLIEELFYHAQDMDDTPAYKVINNKNTFDRHSSRTQPSVAFMHPQETVQRSTDQNRIPVGNCGVDKVNIHIPNLQITRDLINNLRQACRTRAQIEESIILRPVVVNLDADSLPHANRTVNVCRRGTSPASPLMHRHESRSLNRSKTGQKTRSHSSSPSMRRQTRSPSTRPDVFDWTKLDLDIAVPMDDSSSRTCLTSSKPFHLDRSKTIHSVPDHVGQNEAKMWNYCPLPTHFPSTNQVCVDLVVPEDRLVRFQLFVQSAEGADMMDLDHQPMPSLMASTYVTIRELQTALMTKTHGGMNTRPRGRIFLPLYSPGLGVQSIYNHTQQRGPQSLVPVGRIELTLEPIGRPHHHPEHTTHVERTVTRTVLSTASLNAPLMNPVGLDHCSSAEFPITNGTSDSFQLPLEILLSVPEGRGLYLSINPSDRVSSPSDSQPVLTPDYNDFGVQHSYLIFRLPWCQSGEGGAGGVGDETKRAVCRFHSAVCWLGGPRPSYRLALRTPCLLDQHNLRRLKQSFAVIEVWAKFSSGSQDRLLGLVKLPTNSLVALFTGPASTMTHVEDVKRGSMLQTMLNLNLPAIVVNSWLPIIDPFTGSERGQLRVRLAVGTKKQINQLQTTDADSVQKISAEGTTTNSADWRAMDVIQWPEAGNLPDEGRFVEHTLSVTIEALHDFDPHMALRSDEQLAGSVPWGDCDCFVQYFFPTGTQPDSLARYRTPVQLLVGPSLENLTERQEPCSPIVSCRFVVARSSTANGTQTRESYWRQTHRVCFSCSQRGEQTEDRVPTSLSTANKGFARWLLDVFSQNGMTNSSPHSTRGLPLELWLRIYSPNLRDCQVARGLVSEQLLNALLDSIPSDQSNPEDTERHLRCSVPLHCIRSDRPNGQLDLCLTHRSRFVKRPQSNRFHDSSDDAMGLGNKLFPSLSSMHLVANTLEPGIRLDVQLHGIRSQRLSAMNPIHLRLHCLFLLPTLTAQFGSPPRSDCILLGSTTSSMATETRSLISSSPMTLEVLLPLSWRLNEPPATNGQTQAVELTLVELLLNGMETQAAQFAHCITSKACLMIQVDVWQNVVPAEVVAMGSFSGEQSTRLDEDSMIGWNGPLLKGPQKSIHPGSGHRLLASTRIPLGGILLKKNASLSRNWYPLCQFWRSPVALELDDSTGLQQRGTFFGAVQLSAQFLNGARAKHRLLKHVARHHNRNSTPALSLLRWKIPALVLTTVDQGTDNENPISMELDEDPCLWDNGTDENGFTYKHFTIQLSGARIPSAEQLMKPSSIMCDSNLNTTLDTGRMPFTGYVFVRFQFYKQGAQTSRLVPLPTGAGRCQSGIVNFDFKREYVLRVSSELRHYLSESDVEFQIWTLWTNQSNDGSAMESHNRLTRKSRLESDPPSPRHIGSVHVPLAQLLHPIPPATTSVDCSSTQEYHPAIQVGDAPHNARLVGDASGLAWWSSPGSNASGQSTCNHIPVFPIIHDEDCSELLDPSWLSITMAVRSSRAAYSHSADYTPLDAMPSVVPVEDGGQLGWNLASVSECLPTSRPNMGAPLSRHLGDDSMEEATFPAELLVERAYHLHLTTTDRNMTSPNDSMATEGSVFVTFSADGDKRGTLSSPDGLWDRVVQARREPATHGRVAVTTKVRNAESVCWNYHRFVRLPIWLVRKSVNRCLSFHVWLQPDTNEPNATAAPTTTSELNTMPQLIGMASVDLTSLAGLLNSSGLPHSLWPQDGGATGTGMDEIHGWYHVNNDVGEPCGQILLGVKPLIPNGGREERMHQSSLEMIPSSNHFGSTTIDPARLSPLSTMRRLLMPDAQPQTLHSDPFSQINQSLPDLTSAMEPLGSIGFQPLMTTDAAADLSRSVLFTNLRTQLGELDVINNRFKERLINGTFSSSSQQHLSSQDDVSKTCVHVANPNEQPLSRPLFNETTQHLGLSPRGLARERLTHSPVQNDRDISFVERKFISCSSIDLTAGDVEFSYQKEMRDGEIMPEKAPSPSLQSHSNTMGDIEVNVLEETSSSDHRFTEPLRLDCSIQSFHAGVSEDEDRAYDCQRTAFSSPQRTMGGPSRVTSEPTLNDLLHSMEYGRNFLPIDRISRDGNETEQSSPEVTDSETCEISPLSVRHLQPLDSSFQQLPTVQCGTASVYSDVSESLTLEEDGAPAQEMFVADQMDDDDLMESRLHSSCADHLSDTSWPATEVSTDVPVDGEQSADLLAEGFAKDPNDSTPRQGTSIDLQQTSAFLDPMNHFPPDSGLQRTEYSTRLDSQLIPSFFPSTSTLSKRVVGPGSCHFDEAEPLADRAERVRALRIGLRQSSEGCGVRHFEDTQYDAIRRRVDERISEAMQRIGQGPAPLKTSTTTTADPVSIDTPLSRPNDPFATILSGYRKQSLQLAEKVFHMDRRL